MRANHESVPPPRAACGSAARPGGFVKNSFGNGLTCPRGAHRAYRGVTHASEGQSWMGRLFNPSLQTIFIWEMSEALLSLVQTDFEAKVAHSSSSLKATLSPKTCVVFP